LNDLSIENELVNPFDKLNFRECNLPNVLQQLVTFSLKQYAKEKIAVVDQSSFRKFFI
jgi:hypothetical protein